MQHRNTYQRSRFKKRLLSQVISAGLLATAATSTLAGDFVLVGNQISWNKGAVSGTATIAENGVASEINLVNTNNATTLPNVTFSLEDYASLSDTYSLGIYMEVNSDSGNNQVEMSLGTVRVTTVNGSITSVAMVTNSGDAHYRPVEVNAQKVSGGSTLNLSASFAAKANMISNPAGNQNQVTIQVDNVVSALSGNNGLFDDIIERFASNGDYSYHIGIQFLDAADNNATDAELGTYDDDNNFTASNVGAPAITLGAPTLATKFPSASYITGEFNIVDELPDNGGSTGGGGGGGDDGENVVDDDTLNTIEEDNAALDNAVEDAINDGGEVPETVVTQTRDAVQQSADAIKEITDAISGGTTVEPNNILEAARRIAQTVKTATTVINNSSSETRDEVEETTRQAVQNLVTAVNNLKQRGVELNTVQQGTLNTVVENMAPSISGLARRSQTQEDVDAQSARLNQLSETLSGLNVDPTPEVSQAVTESGRAIQKRKAELAAGGPLTDQGVADQFNTNPGFRQQGTATAPPAPPAAPPPPSTTTDSITSRYGSGAFSAVTGQLGSQSAIDNSGTPVTAGLNGTYGSNMSGGLAGSGVGGALGNAGRPGNTNLPATGGLGGGLGGGFGGGLASQGLGQGIGGFGGGNAIRGLLGNQREILAATDTEAKYSAEYDELTGLFTINLGTETYLATLRSVKPAPTLAATQFDFMPDGNAVFIDKGYAYILAPGASSLVGFLAATDGQSFTPNVRADGSFYLELTETERFSGTFAFENMRGLDTDACVTVSFEPPTQEVNSAEYAFTMRCDDVDVSQRILPYVDAASFLNSVTAFDLDVSFNRVNGFVTVEGIGNLKPSFFVREATAAETAFHTANQDDFGLAYMGEDVNGDGKLDYKVISETGVQVLYAAD